MSAQLSWADYRPRPLPEPHVLTEQRRQREAARPADQSVEAMAARAIAERAATKAGEALQSAEQRIAGMFRTRDDLRAMPELEPLVEGYLYLDTVARPVGEPGSYKSFLALDWAASVVTGRQWQGKPVTQGRAVYLVGEGVRGIDARLTAWEVHRNGGESAPVEVFDGVVDLAAPAQRDRPTDWQALGRALVAMAPSLIVVDTQARYTPGHEENSATDMGVFIHNLDALRRVTGACVLLVHHTSRGTDHGRGSTAIEGGVQTELVVVRDKRGAIRLKTEKQKDIEEPDPLPLLAVPVAGTSSIVLDGVGGTAGDPFTSVPASVTAESPAHERLAAVMHRVFGHGTSGASKAEAKAALQGDDELRIAGEARKVSRRFPEAWAALEARNALEPMVSTATGNPVQRFKVTGAYAASLGLVDDADSV
ncbi:AAA family ATPase [Rhodococcoides kroppenstedtii]|uniref:AAA family ATPase n=1 Tax=Rhodococcoides kroppenstedtii TaxID=293050 RepID=UPI0028ED5629|nr:AAA family ATPase [Rhodococcus kroppenstedtii]